MSANTAADKAVVDIRTSNQRPSCSADDAVSRSLATTSQLPAMQIDHIGQEANHGPPSRDRHR